MAIAISDQPRKTGDIGGQPKQTYWTPDGRQIRAMPDMHEYGRTDDKGRLIETGIRDANLDKGWLLYKPTDLKLYCSHCDRWHDTQREITACGNKRKAFIAKHAKKAKKEIHPSQVKDNDDRISQLENDIAEIKNLLTKLVKG